MSGATRDEKLREAARHATVMDDTAEVGARKYAEALVNVAAQSGQVDLVLDDLDEIVEHVVKAHPELRDIFGSPTLAQSDRDRLLVRLFEGKTQPIVLNFLRLLNRNHRLGLVSAIARQAREYWDRRLNRKVVQVRSAVPLDEAQKARLAGELNALIGAEPILRVELDPALLGGLLVQIGDQVYDYSVRAQLERMRRQLVQDRLQQIRGRLAEAATTS